MAFGDGLEQRCSTLLLAMFHPVAVYVERTAVQWSPDVFVPVGVVWQLGHVHRNWWFFQSEQKPTDSDTVNYDLLPTHQLTIQINLNAHSKSF